MKEFFSEDIAHAKDYVPMAVLHRGLDAWYYALLFEYEKLAGDSKQRYRIRIVEVPHVDDIGTIHVSWDCGSSLGVVLGEDSCTRIDEEDVHD